MRHRRAAADVVANDIVVDVLVNNAGVAGVRGVTTDGFELARIDLELRAEGDVLGAMQSGGRSSLKLLRVVRDGDLIAQAREAASEILVTDPELSTVPALRQAISRRLSDSEAEFLDKN